MKTIDDLILQSSLVDVMTGEIIGYIIVDTDTDAGYRLALTKKKMEAEGLDLASWVDYAESEELQVVTYQNKFADVSFARYRAENLIDVPFERLSDNTVAIYGYVFDTFRLIPLDSDFAIQQVKEVLSVIK